MRRRKLKASRISKKRKEGLKRRYGIGFDKLITKDMEDFQEKWPI
jgi:hypothetical protein